jgi:beta-xylosidase
MVILAFLTANLLEAQVQMPDLHDPVIIRQHDTYYLFSTGRGISMMSSTNLRDWKYEGPVFSEPLTWAQELIPGFRHHIWAPDIIFHDDTYHLFYSVSAFGKNTSAIGRASTPTLDRTDPAYKWTDHGLVLQSVVHRDFWNAIDPHIIIDEGGTPWMSFGSFWGGLKLVKLTNDLSSVTEPQEWHTLVKGQRSPFLDDSEPGDGAVEAPFIFKKGNYYYLFASYDYCCRREKSDYNIRVGRSRTVQGPYLDKEGNSMAQGGGTMVMQGNEQWAGVGHNAVYHFDGTDYLVAHGYLTAENGTSKLIIREMNWDADGWPIVSWNERAPVGVRHDLKLDSIRLSDPYILADKATQTYYMTGTGGRMWKSKDLETWSGPYRVIETNPASWMGPRPMIWAAEIHEHNGKYFNFATFTNREVKIDTVNGNIIERRACHVLVSDRPDGPYLPMNDPEYLPAHMPTLDGTFWVEPDGTPYMIFCHEWLQNGNGTMERIQLKPDLSGTIGEAKILFRASDSPWSREKDEEGNDVPNKVTDGPFLFRTQTGRLGMIWTSWIYDVYTQGVAYSESGTINGPWIHEKDPITPPNFGHGMMFRTFEGELLMAVHSHRSVNGVYMRYPKLFRVDDRGERIVVFSRTPEH